MGKEENALEINGLQLFNLVLWVIIIVYALYTLYRFVEARRAAKLLTPDEFKENMRKVQIVDVREQPEFVAGHILGARNIPYTTFKQRYKELRKDQAVYLYDQKAALSGRAAALLKKQGYTDVFVLKGGYDAWDGKIKKGV